MRIAHVQVVSTSTFVDAASLRRAVRALQRQVRDDFAPAWGIGADIELVPRARVHPRAWVLAIVDDARSAEYDGWHEVTRHGMPMAKVFARKAVADSGECHLGRCTRPLQLLAGGYASVSHGDGVSGWRDLSPRKGTRVRRHGSRHARRRLPRDQWRRSG